MSESQNKPTRPTSDREWALLQEIAHRRPELAYLWRCERPFDLRVSLVGSQLQLVSTQHGCLLPIAGEPMRRLDVTVEQFLEMYLRDMPAPVVMEDKQRSSLTATDRLFPQGAESKSILSSPDKERAEPPEDWRPFTPRKGGVWPHAYRSRPCGAQMWQYHTTQGLQLCEDHGDPHMEYELCVQGVKQAAVPPAEPTPAHPVDAMGTPLPLAQVDSEPASGGRKEHEAYLRDVGSYAKDCGNAIECHGERLRMPTWDELPPHVQGLWERASDSYMQRHAPWTKDAAIAAATLAAVRRHSESLAATWHVERQRVIRLETELRESKKGGTLAHPVDSTGTPLPIAQVDSQYHNAQTSPSTRGLRELLQMGDDIRRVTYPAWEQLVANKRQDQPHPEQVPMAGGKALSTRVAPLHLIPTVALESLAERFATGIVKKKDKAWNANSDNQEVLDDLEFAIDRCGHAMLHAMQMRDKLRNRDVAAILKDDDAGAIAWAGAFLACVVDRLVRRETSDEAVVGTSGTDGVVALGKG